MALEHCCIPGIYTAVLVLLLPLLPAHSVPACSLGPCGTVRGCTSCGCGVAMSSDLPQEVSTGHCSFLAGPTNLAAVLVHGWYKTLPGRASWHRENSSSSTWHLPSTSTPLAPVPGWCLQGRSQKEPKDFATVPVPPSPCSFCSLAKSLPREIPHGKLYLEQSLPPCLVAATGSAAL